MTMPLGEFLGEQLAISKEFESAETDEVTKTDEIIENENFETPIRPSTPRYELPIIPEGYVMDAEIARDFLACKDREDLKKLLVKLKEKSLNAGMQYEPKFATSPILLLTRSMNSLSILS